MPSSLHSHHYQIFRSLLVAAREHSGLTQVQIAKKLGRPQSFISKYERGERRLDFSEFVELADALGIDVADFINEYRAATMQAGMRKSRKVSK